MHTPPTACWGGGTIIPSAKLLLGGTLLHNLNKLKTDMVYKEIQPGVGGTHL
ncbi:hypothetical protein I79_010298 [Cricetulus griseus]|uniref:Uncharacterized protein n=1 Tax=Cricetulus griseus TaxID=10029 RepID=G3HI33_CRIGR|nr:hypothetical protein I79_010298 [Cricetulus griseus]